MNNNKSLFSYLQSIDTNICLTALESYLRAIKLGNARNSSSGKVLVEILGTLDIDGLPFEVAMDLEDYNNIKKLFNK